MYQKNDRAEKDDLPAVKNESLSLADLAGEGYVEAVARAKGFLEGTDPAGFLKIAREKVDLAPSSWFDRLNKLVEYTGKKVVEKWDGSAEGAATSAFRKATHKESAPLSASGVTRIGEDGRAYLISKSEHYHAPLGHDFPGYLLIEKARRLGIPNTTHNNTRGHITRLLEEELVRIVNGIAQDDRKGLAEVLRADDECILNRVINLETGSLAVEAAIKMMLTRFYRLDTAYPKPVYEGRIPVFLVIADHDNGKEANYHGTTVIAQTFRGLWPGLYEKAERHGLYKVIPVKINDIEHFEKTVMEYDEGKYKIAGFLHEIVLMNYGGILLRKDYLQTAYGICKERDIPVLVDEIQSNIWSPEFFLFKEYGLKPDFVSIGKGFPGGQYPASRIITHTKMDHLNLFGALVTNGQEELASLAYLITIRFVEANKEYIRNLGEYYEKQLRTLGKEYNHIITTVEGIRHMTTLFFETPEKAIEFSSLLNKRGIDISTQAYKHNIPPSALTKIPLVSTPLMVDYLVTAMREVLEQLGE